MKRICLIRPGVTGMLQNKVDIPYGLLCLGSALEQNGFDIIIKDLTDENYEIIPEADIYGITSYTVYYNECLKIKEWLRKNRNPFAPVAVGGPHASAMYNEIKNDGFDYIMVGDGEITFPNIANNMKQNKESVIVFGERVEDLDDFPLDYRLINPDEYTRKTDRENAISIMSSRGCLFNCAFCWTANNYNSKVRYKSAENTLKEIDNIFELYGYRNICFLDDSFLTDIQRAKQIMDGLKSRNIKWECEANALHLQDVELCKKIVASGCYRIFIGVESGSDFMLKLMNKPQTTKIVKNAINNIKSVGDIRVRASVMVGFPGETWDTVNESIDFLLDLNIDEFTLYTFTPFPGTLPFENMEKYGITRINDRYDDFFLLKGNAESSYSFETKELNSIILKEMRIYMQSRLEEKFKSSAKAILSGDQSNFFNPKHITNLP